jgi:hypothetical protein
VIGAVGFIKTPLKGSNLNSSQKVENIYSPFGILLNKTLNVENTEKTINVENPKNSDWGAFIIFLLEETQQSLENPKGKFIEISKKEAEINFILQKFENNLTPKNREMPKISLLKKIELKTFIYNGQQIQTKPEQGKTPSAQKIAKTAKVLPNLENHTKVFRLKIPIDRETVLLIKATKHHFNAVIKTSNENFALLQGGLQSLAESIVSLGFTSATLRLQAASTYGRVKNTTDNNYDNNRGKNGEPHPLKDSKNPFGPLFGGGSLSFFL